MMTIPAVYRRLLFAIILLGFGSMPLHAQREKLSPEDLAIVTERWPDAKRTYTGLRYVVLKEAPADAPSPKNGDVVKVFYKGMLLNGTVFDQSADRDHPLKAKLGRDGLIDGWEEALRKMRLGEKWLLIVPYELAYGTRGRPPSIPRKSTLVFEMELLEFGRDLE